MKNRSYSGAAVAVFCVALGFGRFAFTQTPAPISSTTPKDSAMTPRAIGTFEVKLTPLPPDDKTENATISRMLIDKQIHGDLEATSKGQMLAAGNAAKAAKGSGGYVALEQVSGTLHGRCGTFVLQHSGTMTRGAPQLTITVVPDSGTDELAGLAGKMTISIVDGKHSYEFEYTFAKTP
jgi:hypothetical protein